MGNDHSKHHEIAFQQLTSQFSNTENAILMQDYDSMARDDLSPALRHATQAPAKMSVSSFMVRLISLSSLCG
jgi:hypothetical protein